MWETITRLLAVPRRCLLIRIFRMNMPIQKVDLPLKVQEEWPRQMLRRQFLNLYRLQSRPNQTGRKIKKRSILRMPRMDGIDTISVLVFLYIAMPVILKDTIYIQQ